MKKITQFILNDKEKQAIKNVVDTIECDCDCGDKYSNCQCPFLMENGGCMIEALDDIVKESE